LSTSSGTGTIDNAYGIYIDTVNIGTTNWGLYVATTARNYMAGDLTVASIGVSTAGTGKFTTLEATSTVKFGTHTAIGAETVTGFITINDAGGTSRKLAVVS
jgi:hypothetical protein